MFSDGEVTATPDTKGDVTAAPGSQLPVGKCDLRVETQSNSLLPNGGTHDALTGF